MKKVASYEEFVRDTIKGEVIDYKNPNCSNCNDCCSMGAMLTEKEYLTIKKYLKTDPNGKQLMKRAKKLISDHRQNGLIYWVCPLSTASKKCGIYHIRPQVCRDFHCSPELGKIIDREMSSDYSIYNLFDNNKEK